MLPPMPLNLPITVGSIRKSYLLQADTCLTKAPIS